MPLAEPAKVHNRFAFQSLHPRAFDAEVRPAVHTTEILHDLTWSYTRRISDHARSPWGGHAGQLDLSFGFSGLCGGHIFT